MLDIYKDQRSRATIHNHVEVSVSIDNQKYDVVELHSKLSNFDIVGVVIKGKQYPFMVLNKR